MSRIETLNRQGIRETVWAMADFKPQNSPEAVARMNTFIRLAEWDVAKDAPFLFSEALLRTVVLPNVEMALTTDTLEATDDPWVLKATLSSATTGVTEWQEDASWDGRQIHLKDPATDGVWHLYTIREAWESGTDRYISLDRPWPTSGDTDIEFVVYQHPLRLPSNVIEVKAIQVFDDETEYPVEIVSQGAAEWASVVHPSRLMPTGTPRRAFRRPMRRLDAPAFTPVVAAAQGAWATTRSPIGRFEYCFTYVVGKSETWELNGTPQAQTSVFPYPTSTTERAYQPFLESPPSAVSAAIASTALTHITVTLPNVDSMLGFNEATTARYRRAGVKKRIYRRRISDTTTAPYWEARDRFYLLAEVDGHETTFTDTGAYIPEWNVPLLDNHGFELISMFPAADDRYDVQIRATVAPPGMETDTDTPHLPGPLLKPLLHRVLAYLYESLGNGAMKASALKDYEEGLEQLRKNRGDLRPSGVPRSRAVASPRGRRRGRMSPKTTPGDGTW